MNFMRMSVFKAASPPKTLGAKLQRSPGGVVIMRLFHLRNADVGVDHKERQCDSGKMIKHRKRCAIFAPDAERSDVS